MKKKLYFVGGAKGVGKSSLLNSNEILAKRIEIVNTGDFFNKAKEKYCNNYKEIAKKNILNYLVKNAPLIVDTHYSGFVNGIGSGQFERALYREELDSLARNSELELILITLDPALALERRIYDLRNERDLNYLNIKEEIEANKLYFEEYCNQLNKKGTIIENINFDESVKKLSEIINPFSS